LRDTATSASIGQGECDVLRIRHGPGGIIRIRPVVDAAVAAILVLITLNAVLWHLVFPGELLENYVYPRPSPMLGYELAAIIVTALLLVTVYAVCAPAARGWPAAALGGLLGLLASAPAQLLVFAVVESDPRRDVIHVLWTVLSWAIAGSAIGWFLNRRRVQA
jgi:hypothetical protein